MTVKTAGAMLALFMLAVLAIGIAQRFGQRAEVVGWGSIKIAPGPGQLPIDLMTREVRIGTVLHREVELPGGTWIDCAGDCVTAAREAGPDFWETVRRNSGGR